MKISRIKLTNILGHESLDIVPGKVNVVKGKNGSGKTSIIEALKAALRGGSLTDATLLRNGAEEGEIVLVFDDGTVSSKAITPSGSKIKITGQSKPVAFLDSIRDLTSINPVSLLLAEKKDLIRLIIESMNVKFSPDEIFGAAAERVPDALNLDEFGNMRKRIYDERTGVNRSLKDKNSTLKEMVESLPKDLAAVSPETLAEKREKLAELSEKRVQYTSELESKRAEEIAAVNAKFDALKAEMTAKFEAAHTPLVAEISSMEQTLTQSASLANQKRMIGRMQEEASALSEQAETLTDSLTKLDELHKSKLAAANIAGLSIQDGEVYIDGTRWEHVNTARKVQFCLSVARLRAGELGVVCLDNMECLDESVFAAFEMAAKKTDLQFFVTRVADQELTVSSN